MGDVIAINHHAAKHSEFRYRRADQLQVIAKRRRLERQWLQCTSETRSPLQFVHVIRVKGASTKLYVRLVFESIDNARPGGKKCIAKHGRTLISDSMLQKPRHFFIAVVCAKRDRMACQRYPCRSRGKGSCASKMRAPFDQEHPRAFKRRRNRRRQPSCARPEDSHVIRPTGFAQCPVHAIISRVFRRRILSDGPEFHPRNARVR